MILLYLTRFSLPTQVEQRHRVASGSAHALLRWALREMDIDPGLSPVCYTSEGKPYLAHTDLQISIAHSGPWAVCVISNAPVGVDIERIRSVSEGAWKRYLANFPQEPCGDAYESILRWTRYEASLKRLGHPAPLVEGVEFSTLTAIPGYLITVCGEEEVTSVRWVPQINL